MCIRDSVSGYNLLAKLGDFDKTVWQGINGAIYALLALDAFEYEIPQVEEGTVQTTREKLIQHILDREMVDKDGIKGGFALNTGNPDPDITGMALQALAPYQDKPEVEAAIERALAALSKMQLTNGGFVTVGGNSDENCESIVQVVTALSALGIDAQKDERFVKTDDQGQMCIRDRSNIVP